MNVTTQAMPLTIRPRDLLFFVDETGHEEFADPAHPVFGYGGCAVMGADYDMLIRQPWLKTGNRFYRFAAIQKVSTELRGDLSTYKTAAIALMKRFEDIAKWCPIDRILAVFESSMRLDRMADRFFPGLGLSEETATGTVAIPIEWLRMSKREGEAGLEVADFVMHAAGGQVRERQKGNKRFRKDFKAVSRTEDDRRVSYIDIDQATFTPKAPPQ